MKKKKTIPVENHKLNSIKCQSPIKNQNGKKERPRLGENKKFNRTQQSNSSISSLSKSRAGSCQENRKVKLSDKLEKKFGLC